VKLPADLVFTDGDGRTVRLGDYFDGERPLVIQMAYYRCPKLCGEISKGMIRSIKSLSEELKISNDFQVVTISFDSRETPALAGANRDAVVEVLGRTAGETAVREGWDFLVGDDVNIKALADALGYRFGWIEEAQQYSHPAAVVVVAPDGTVSRYLYGTSYDPSTLRLSLVDASQGTISPSLKDVFILSCFDYDPAVGKYTATAYTLMRIAGVTTVVTLASIIGFLLIAERRGKLRRLANAGTSIEDLEEQDGQPRPPRTAFS
jgi:protein SCO1/2